MAHDEVHWLEANLRERRLEVWSVVENDVVGVSQVGVDGGDAVVEFGEVWIKEELKNIRQYKIPVFLAEQSLKKHRSKVWIPSYPLVIKNF